MAETAIEKVSKVGQRVTWRREVYRMRYADRPWDTGTVETVDGLWLTVRDDRTGNTVRGTWTVFSVLTIAETSE